MAVRASVDDVMRSIRAVDNPEVRAEIETLLVYAGGEVTRIAPGAGYRVHDRAATQLVGYLFDRPTAARGVAYANALRNSGGTCCVAALPQASGRKHGGND